jgi:hypothetical protein
MPQESKKIPPGFFYARIDINDSPCGQGVGVVRLEGKPSALGIGLADNYIDFFLKLKFEEGFSLIHQGIECVVIQVQVCFRGVKNNTFIKIYSVKSGPDR